MGSTQRPAFGVRELSPRLGAEITGIDLSGDLDESTRHDLRFVLDRRGVLVFRDVDVDFESQLYLVESLHHDQPVLRDTADVAFSHVSNVEPDGGAPYGRLMFHCDMMWSPLAHQVASLYAVEAAQPSVPTTFVSGVHGWSTLSDDLKERLSRLHAEHWSGRQGRATVDDDTLLQPEWSTLRSTITPVALRHPRTGDVVLYVCEQQTRRIVELPEPDSDHLLDELFAHLYSPARVFEHPWRTGDLVVWDNQLVQHGRPYVTAGGPARTLRKVHAPRNLVRLIGSPTYETAGAPGERDEMRLLTLGTDADGRSRLDEVSAGRGAPPANRETERTTNP